MSAIARYMNSQQTEVHGYDKTETTLTRTLASEGITIHYEDNISYIPEGVDLVVYTPAVPEQHQELQYFRKEGYVVKKRAEVLGIISQSKKTLAVAGTHGKTTTSSIAAHLIRSCGVDAAAFLGGIALNFDSNYVSGQSDWVVVEADEYDRSFLHLRPDIAILLSMDADHLDIYGSGEQVVVSFRAFGNCIKDGGTLIIHQQLLEVYGRPALEELEQRNIDIISYGLEAGQCRASAVQVSNGHFVFDYLSPTENIPAITFRLPGHHNTENATAAIAAAQQLGLGGEAIKAGLASFKGIKRRFEMIYQDKRSVYIDDYAHHPSELRAAIAAARSLFPDRKITGVFQPHLYSRTRDFAEGFAQALDELDELLLLDIYPARELPIPGISSTSLLDRMNNPSKSLISKSALLDHLRQQRPEVLLTLGAGDIGALVEPIKALLSDE